ncbi:very short patch repair endonuclease [Rhodococcus jostii]|uniref:Very short patch repair endonuclease n=1 Tax=Rhodococcus jostii TaxID=132919 RepID=A0ABU4CDZ9_RHOJO|nr:very short patch repair endonuclease [Rhodococcus jostii]MDV6281500.1 very short patch repair endonuclease [Rhodococcus jostii]
MGSGPGGKRHPVPLDEGRARNMRANRRVDSKPEVQLRKRLHSLGFRFRKDYRMDLGDTRVRPDIVFTAKKVAVFVDGCFWHVCPVHGREPTRNEWYWTPKLRRNVERDQLADQALADAGWTVVRIWEHELLDAATAAVVEVLSPGVGLPARVSIPKSAST